MFANPITFSQLAPELRSDVLIDDLPFQWPKIDTSDWTIGGGVRRRSQQNPQSGEMNSNLKEPHVTCQPASGYCIRPVQIFGQCCKEQCGAVMQWRQNSLNFSAALELTRETERKVLVVHEDVGISLIRIDETDPHPLYQLAVIPRHFSNFDEQLFSDTLDFAFEALRFAAGEDSGGTSSYYALKRQCSSNAAFFLNLGALFKWVALGGFMAAIATYIFYDQYSKNDRFRSVVLNCLQASASSSQNGGSRLRLAVAWRRAREEVELLWNASRTSLPKMTRRVSANTNTGTSPPEGEVTTSVQLVEYANPVFSTLGEEITEASEGYKKATSELS